MRLEKFLIFIQSLENFNYVNVWYLTNSTKNCPTIEYLPRMIMGFPPADSLEDIKGIKHEGDNLTYFHLNLLFNKNCLTIAFLNNEFVKHPALETISLQTESKFLLVFEDSVNFETIEKFTELGFINVIGLNVLEFENMSKFYAFNIFPEFEVVEHYFSPSLRNPFKNHVSNINESRIYVSCPHEIPNCMILFNNGTPPTIKGIMVNILLDFADFINASLDLYFDSSVRAFNPNFDGLDILAYTIFLPASTFHKNFIAFQRSTYPLDTLHVFIVVPSPKPLRPMFYPFKPFSWDIWLVLGCVVLYTSILLKLSSPKSRLEIGEYFTNIFKLSIAQSVSYNHNDVVLSFCFMLNSVFGFILSLWYGAILGSFLTTILKEPRIESFDDIRSKGLEIAAPKIPLYKSAFKNMPEVSDLVHFYWYDDFMNLSNNMDDKYAFAEDSNHWNYFMVPQMDHYEDPRFHRLKFNLGSSFLSISLKENSIYKSKFNRVIHILKDVGLYQKYTDMVFLDNLKYKYVRYKLRTEIEKVRVLGIDYFEYVFFILVIGEIIAFAVFLLENIKNFFKKRNFNVQE